MSAKTTFQVERIAFFSDAVFAIAITLMIIEVKPPHLPHHASIKEALLPLARISPMIMGVILSFIFIGLFWLRHHQLMKHVEQYTPKLMFLNMALLLTIIFLPFSTAFVFENMPAQSPIPLTFYNINFIIASIFNYCLFAYVLNPANGIIAPDDPERIDKHRFELLFPIAVYFIVLLAAYISVPFAPTLYSLFGLQGLLQRKKKKAMLQPVAIERNP